MNKYQKWLKLFIYMVTIFAISTPFLAKAYFFNDVNTKHPFYTAIRYLKFMGVVQGYSVGVNTTFMPDSKITRAEFVKIAIAAKFSNAEIQNCQSQKKFFDVQAGDWFSPYVCVATNHNIVEGFSDNTFKPHKNINFTEASKIISIAFGYQEQSNTIWFKPYVEHLERNHVPPVSIVSVAQEITRGEMAEMIFRLMAKVYNKSTTSFFVAQTPPLFTENNDMCAPNHFKMAFIILTEPSVNLTDSRLNTFKTLGTVFEKAFFNATDHLAVMHVDEVATFQYQKDWLVGDPSKKVLDYTKIAKKFYETHGDDYEFLSVFEEFEPSSGTKPHHLYARNKIKNIGLGDINYGEELGSKSKLLGINAALALRGSASSEKDYIVWMLLHETGHQWCCAGVNRALDITASDGWHLSSGLEAPNISAIMSELGNVVYAFNKKNGTYIDIDTYYAEKEVYHPFILYFMGVLPPDLYNIEYEVYEPAPYSMRNEDGIGLTKFIRNISVNDIINVMGKRSCES